MLREPIIWGLVGFFGVLGIGLLLVAFVVGEKPDQD